MIKKNKFLIILILSSIIYINSCKKEVYYKLDNEFKSYFGLFKDGSWWLMQDTINNLKDSLYIKDYKAGREADGPRSKIFYEYINYLLYSNKRINWAFVTKGNELRKDNNHFHYEQKFSSFDYFNLSVTKDYNKFDNNCNNCGINKIINYKNKYYSFENVIKVWNKNDTFYYAKDIGLIQYRISNKNFILINYHVNY